MPSISIPTAILGAGALSAGAAVLGSSTASNAATAAAKTQAKAATTASDNTLNEFNETQANLAPFVTSGQGALGELTNLTGSGPGENALTAPLTAPFNPTQAQLAATPGYQFTLGQGLESTQNSYAAEGLGTSGAAAKGAANYAEGLASTTYQQQFQNYWAQNQAIYQMLGGLATTGENAAATTGSQGLTASQLAGGFSTSGAAATAAGQVGSANATVGGVNALSASLGNTALLTALTGNNGLFASPPAQQSSAPAVDTSFSTQFPASTS